MSGGVLYFHGFASSPRSQKIGLLRDLLPAGVPFVAPDMNVPSFEQLDFSSIMDVALEHARPVPPAVIVGSSMGALIALELVRRGLRAPLVLIAPAVGIGERWITRLPPGDPISVFNHARNGQAFIRRGFFEEMQRSLPESEAPASRVVIVMGRNDESVPFDLVRDVWERWTASATLVPGSKFIEIAAGDHGLVGHIDVIAREIVACLKLPA